MRTYNPSLSAVVGFAALAEVVLIHPTDSGPLVVVGFIICCVLNFILAELLVLATADYVQWEHLKFALINYSTVAFAVIGLLVLTGLDAVSTVLPPFVFLTIAVRFGMAAFLWPYARGELNQEAQGWQLWWLMLRSAFIGKARRERPGPDV